MNATNKHIISLLVLLLTLQTAAYAMHCNKDHLYGDWKVVDCIITAPEHSLEIIQQGKKEALSTEYEFREKGGVLMRSLYHVDGIEKPWQLNCDEKTLAFTNEDTDSKRETYTLVKMNRHKMVWTQDMGELGTIMLILEKLEWH